MVLQIEPVENQNKNASTSNLSAKVLIDLGPVAWLAAAGGGGGCYKFQGQSIWYACWQLPEIAQKDTKNFLKLKGVAWQILTES